MNKNFKNVLLFIGIPIVLIFAVSMISNMNRTTAQKQYYEIVNLVTDNKVSEYKLNLYSGELTYKLRDDKDNKHCSRKQEFQFQKLFF